MTRNTSSGRKRNTRRRPAAKAKGRVRQFFKAFSITAVTSFVAATYALHPDPHALAPIHDLLARIPGLAYKAPAPLAPTQGQHTYAQFAQCPQFLPPGAGPVVPAQEKLRELCFDAFAILHNGETKTPVFVAQRLNRQMLLKARDVERVDRFYAEARLPAAERAELDDYRNSGYSRGHMAPAGDMHTVQAMAQSFSLANMSPQDQRQNAGAWNQIEADTRKYILRAKGDVYVFTGPVYEKRPQTVRAGRVAVPDYFFKLVFDAQSGRSWVYWQANSENARAGRPIDYREFARRTGLYLLEPRS